MSTGVIQVDLNGVITYANQAVYALLEIESDFDMLGVNCSDFFTREFCDVFGESESFSLETLLNNEQGITFLHQDNSNGVEKRISLNANTLLDEDSQQIGIVISLTEVTESSTNDQKVGSQTDRYRILVENINGVVWETESGTKTFSYISPKATELLGFSLEEWLKEGFWQSRIYDKDKERVIAYEKHKAPNVDNYQLDYRLVHKSGKLIWVRDMVEVVKTNENHTKYRGLMLDITERKKSRAQLRQSEQKYKRMISEAPYGISIYSKEGLMVAANAKSAEIWQIDLKDFINKFNIFETDLFAEESQRKRINAAFSGESGEVAAEIPLPNRVKKWFNIKYYPLYSDQGELDNIVFISEDISQFVEAEEKIRLQESLKQNILDALGEAILVVDQDGIIISANKNLKLYIEKESELQLEIGRTIFDFIDLLDDAKYLRDGLMAILKKKSRVFYHEMKLIDNKWYSLRATPLNAAMGAVIAWQNINTRKEIEMALEKSLKKYRNIYSKAPIMMHSMNKDLEIISVSDFWLEKMGYERNEVIGKSPIDFLDDPSKKLSKSYMKRFFRDGEIKNIDYKFRKKSGELIDVLLSAIAEYDEEGNFERSITGMIDVTNLKETQRKLEESEFKLLESQRISKMANYEFDVLDNSFIPSNEMISMMGFTKEKHDLSIITNLVHPEDLKVFNEKLESCIAKGKDFFHDYRIFHLQTKKLKWISGRGKMIKNNRGKVVRMIGTVQDITEQRNAEQKIRRLTDRVLLATEIANLGVWEYDREKDEIYWGDQMFLIFSDTNKPLGLKSLEKYFVGEHKEALSQNFQMIKRGLNFIESEVCINVEGADKYLRSFTRVLRDHQGGLRGLIGVVYDISADKKLQMRLESSLEEKNVLIKEVHHRVKNNLQLISSILALKSYDLEDNRSKDIFNEVNDRIKAMSVIHDKLYTFYNVSEINLSEYLDHIASELQILLGSTDVILKVESETIVLDVEKALLIGLMVSELVANAVKHGFGPKKEGVVRILFNIEEGRYVLRVLNDGNKLPKDVLDKNTGLGISLLKTFAKQLRGEVMVDDNNGFRVNF